MNVQCADFTKGDREIVSIERTIRGCVRLQLIEIHTHTHGALRHCCTTLLFWPKQLHMYVRVSYSFHSVKILSAALTVELDHQLSLDHSDLVFACKLVHLHREMSYTNNTTTYVCM